MTHLERTRRRLHCAALTLALAHRVTQAGRSPEFLGPLTVEILQADWRQCLIAFVLAGGELEDGRASNA